MTSDNTKPFILSFNKSYKNCSNRFFDVRIFFRKLSVLCFFLVFSIAVFGQVVKGVIRDQIGEPIPFAKVWLKNTSHGTISNGKGVYHLELEESGMYDLRISSLGYDYKDTLIEVSSDVLIFNVVLQARLLELEEVVVTSESSRKKGKKIMKKVIAKRSGFLEAAGRYKCETYCFTSLDKGSVQGAVSTENRLNLDMSKMNITEWNALSYFESKNRYKDIITGFIDYTDKVNNSVVVSISLEAELGESNEVVQNNPYVFVNGIKDADINIFKNLISAPSISQRPLISPLAYNAFAYYNFHLEKSFLEGTEMIYEIRVEPIFKEEALFSGVLYIRSESYEPEGYELAVNKGAMSIFNEMRIVCNYENIDGKLLPVRREFVYMITEGSSLLGKTFIHGNSRISHRNYSFQFDDRKRKFWLEEQVYLPESFDRDSSYWEDVRPFYLEDEEKEFIRVQDSISSHILSEDYLLQQDSIYNKITVWDFFFNGLGFRNTFKKRSFRVSSFFEGLGLLGVGGYRQKLGFQYEKEFKNARAIELYPQLDYGFNNKDLKGTFGIGYVYNPMRFSKISLRFGDTYDFINSYQSVLGTFSPANRVRNKVLQVNHEFEVLNGLYFRTGFEFSKRQAITNIENPEWASNLGVFSDPISFEDYTVFITEFEFSYRIGQKYILKPNKKVVTSDKWPILKLKYRKGLPRVFGAQADFDFLEFRMNDKIELNAMGQSEINVIAGAFLRKNELRIVEYKYFRTSDFLFFSNPTNSLQMLDTALSTSNSYLQANFIHHFNGFFLNKIWGINKLKLEETIGGSLLIIPESNFNQIEFYVGLERMFRVKKQLFKIGFYAVAADNNFKKGDVYWKLGINFYDSFRNKWSY